MLTNVKKKLRNVRDGVKKNGLFSDIDQKGG